MAGRPGRSGGHNRAHTPGARRDPLQVTSWPWERARKPWAQSSIFRHLAAELERWGVTHEQAAGDLVRQMADAHWMRMEAVRAVRRGEDKVHGANALGVIQKSNAAIVSGLRALGIYPLPKLRPGAPGQATTPITSEPWSAPRISPTPTISSPGASAPRAP